MSLYQAHVSACATLRHDFHPQGSISTHIVTGKEQYLGAENHHKLLIYEA
jgi:hypothetical protein